MRVWQHATAATHLVVAGIVGVAAGAVAAFLFGWVAGGLTAWVAGAATFLILTWPPIWSLDAQTTARLAQRQDPGRALRDLVLLVVGGGSVIAVAVVIVPAGKSDWPMVTLGVACLAVSWVVVHTIFTLKYARLYYSPPIGGVDFKQDADPNFRDFAYLAFTVGMTFQVSDTDLGTSVMRGTVLRQALLSFLYAAIIIAVTINVIAGLSGHQA